MAYGFEEAIAGSHKMDLRWTPRAQVELDGEIQEGFWTVTGPGRTTHGTSCWRSCSLLLRRHCVAPRAPRTWPRLGTPRKGCCGWSCSCSTGCPATILSAGPSACWTRRRSRPHPAGSWQAFAKANGLELQRCGGGGRQSLARCLRARPAKHAAAHGQSLGGGGANVLGSAQGPGPQRGIGGVGSAGSAVSRRLYRYRGCTALPSRLCEESARAGWRITCWHSRKTRVSCSLRPLGGMRRSRSPQRCRTTRTRHSRSLRMAARHRAARQQLAASRISRALCAGAHHLAQTAAGCPRRSLSGTLLPALQIYARQEGVADRALPLGDREPAALGARCRLRRRSQPNSQKTTRPRTLLSCESSLSMCFAATQ